MRDAVSIVHLSKVDLCILTINIRNLSTLLRRHVASSFALFPVVEELSHEEMLYFVRYLPTNIVLVT